MKPLARLAGVWYSVSNMEVQTMTAIYVQRGDVFFTHSNTLLGQLIRWGEKDKTDKGAPSWANHTGVVVEAGWVGATQDPHAVQAVVVEALWHVRRGPLVLNGTKVRFFRPVPAWTEEELQLFVTTANGYVGAKYGWWKLLVQLGDKVAFGGRKVLTTGLYKDDRPICSYLAGKVVHTAQSARRVANRWLAGYKNGQGTYAFGVPPQACDPDTMMDYCLAHPDLWQEVV